MSKEIYIGIFTNGEPIVRVTPKRTPYVVVPMKNYDAFYIKHVA